MVRAFVGVGSNIKPAEHLRKAIHLLKSQTRILAISTVYRTQAEGGSDQPSYYNCIVEIETEASPSQLKYGILRHIEEKLGRKRSENKNAPRTIDLDLILYGDLVLDTDDLTLPDHQILSRPFLAIPLYELAPHLILPGKELRIQDVADQMVPGSMEPLKSYTELLNKEIFMNSSINTDKIANLVREILVEIGEDPQREGLIKTPQRVAECLTFLTSGYRTDREKLINKARFTQETNSMVILKDIEIYSLCEHHFLPFFGRCHIGYIPKGKIFGASKLARLMDMYAKRLQLQERLTEQIAYAIKDSIDAVGVGVIIEARHLCMMMRGIEKQNSVLVTSALLGSFRESAATRQEFLSLIGRSQQ
jgi:GTP cyclohydrolase I